jgi:hypothetical protein
MQTFLPYPDFDASARSLDSRRLGKQRVEVLQILNALTIDGKGWANHPVTKMWRGHEYQLCLYGIAICRAWRQRGIETRGVPFKDTCEEKIAQIMPRFSNTGLPQWFGSQPFHYAHQSNLVRKDERYYAPQFIGVPNDIPYICP